jgi:hypothetical protein
MRLSEKRDIHPPRIGRGETRQAIGCTNTTTGEKTEQLFSAAEVVRPMKEAFRGVIL